MQRDSVRDKTPCGGEAVTRGTDAQFGVTALPAWLASLLARPHLAVTGERQRSQEEDTSQEGR